jgi:hypothetical protein
MKQQITHNKGGYSEGCCRVLLEQIGHLCYSICLPTNLYPYRSSSAIDIPQLHVH